MKSAGISARPEHFFVGNKENFAVFRSGNRYRTHRFSGAHKGFGENRSRTECGDDTPRPVILVSQICMRPNSTRPIASSGSPSCRTVSPREKLLRRMERQESSFSRSCGAICAKSRTFPGMVIQDTPNTVFVAFATFYPTMQFVYYQHETENYHHRRIPL